MICEQCHKSYDYTESGCRTKYCSNECYLSHKRKLASEYYYNVKKKLPKKFPFWICQECGFKKKLNFFPKKESRRFERMKCPQCKSYPQVALAKKILIL